MASSLPKGQTIVYKTINELTVPLEIYLPDNAKNVPCLLWFHGGGLLQGIRTSVSPHMLRAVNKYNIAVISADYRLAPQVGIAEIYEDVRDCVHFIRNNLAKQIGDGVVNPDRLAVSGSSAGGYLALLAGLYLEPKPQVLLPIYPITDPLGLFFTVPQPPAMGGKGPDMEQLKPYIDPNGPVVANNPPDSARSQAYQHMLMSANLAKLLRFPSGKEGDKWRVAKNIQAHGLPPTYVVHGDSDSAVGTEQADEVVGVMVGTGAEVKYERLHGIEHLFDKEESVELEDMYAFMLAHLK
ncbi:hypothetical protein BAUCODRAFT_336651 [Baudoinia panamericana UAMH 10762]|uniref:BD-FAE-like domain-containing protein n=1 Tax=Baudoinia panamericana (strain UAMH 10762) TaxID=717646 RepID=M2MRG8_BAUPA|nr:uncharacterized protein BAUCODRAFT_336651 [Baudoinia panamericana UAMH 10762]EMC99431.1 hypothetical protein BAUCODRAFT_336651 [Baudoinia panamericana UAMH 10762]